MKRTALVLCGMAVMVSGMANAAVIVGAEDGTDVGGGWGEWTEALSPIGGAAFAFTTVPGDPGYSLGAPHGDALQINVDPTFLLPAPDIIYSTGGNLTGDWNTLGGGVKGITFDFYVGDGASMPVGMNLFFGDNASTFWYLELPVSPSYTGWEDADKTTEDGYLVGYNANVHPSQGWINLLGDDSEAAFFGSLGSVTQVGLDIQWASSDPGGTYGVDNFALHDTAVVKGVPEPGTYMALFTALMSVGVTFRKRLNDTVASLLKR